MKKKILKFKEKWKKDFVEVVAQISQKTKPLSNEYIEDFSVEEAKKYRKSKK